jgi:hypothetical protein
MAEMNTADDRVNEIPDVLGDLRGLVGWWCDAVRRKPRRIPRTLMGYGFALADGTGRYGHPCYLVVTQGGESMVLTYELLRALEKQTLVLCGEVICSLSSLDAIEGEHQPVRSLELLLAVGFSRLQPRDYATVTTRVVPEDLEYTAWSILTRCRPEGWPQ